MRGARPAQGQSRHWPHPHHQSRAGPGQVEAVAGRKTQWSLLLPSSPDTTGTSVRQLAKSRVLALLCRRAQTQVTATKPPRTLSRSGRTPLGHRCEPRHMCGARPAQGQSRRWPQPHHQSRAGPGQTGFAAGHPDRSPQQAPLSPGAESRKQAAVSSSWSGAP